MYFMRLFSVSLSRGLKLPASPLFLCVLDQPDGIAVYVPGPRDQPAAAHVLHFLLHRCARVQEPLQTLLDVVHMIVSDGAGHARVVAVRVKADVLAANLVADVIRLIRIWLYAQQLGE